MEIADKVYRTVYRELELKKEMKVGEYEFFLYNILVTAGFLKNHLKDEDEMMDNVRRDIDEEVGIGYVQGVDETYVVLKDKSSINFDNPKFW